MKLLLTLAVFALAPALAAAQCGHDTARQVMSCAEGTAWDADKGLCVPLGTS